MKNGLPFLVSHGPHEVRPTQTNVDSMFVFAFTCQGEYFVQAFPIDL